MKNIGITTLNPMTTASTTTPRTTHTIQSRDLRGSVAAMNAPPSAG